MTSDNWICITYSSLCGNRKSIVTANYLKQLDANASKNELEKKRDKKDIVDGLHGHDDALYHVLTTQHFRMWTTKTDHAKITPVSKKLLVLLFVPVFLILLLYCRHIVLVSCLRWLQVIVWTLIIFAKHIAVCYARCCNCLCVWATSVDGLRVFW